MNLNSQNSPKLDNQRRNFLQKQKVHIPAKA